MFEVVYYSETGNTRKVAEAIAAQLGVTAKDVGIAGVVPHDAFIFLGMGCYRGELPGAVRAFISENRFRGRRIALFSTSAFGLDTERQKLEKQLEQLGAVIVRNFKCRGRFWDINKEHPTWLELKKAAWFARSAAITLFSPLEERVEELSLVS
jgi:flavodoxin